MPSFSLRARHSMASRGWVESWRTVQQSPGQVEARRLLAPTSLVIVRAVSVVARYEGRGQPALPVRQVRDAARRMLKALRMPEANLSVLLCDDALIHALNRTHRAKDKPTDVLAFAMSEGVPVIGDATLLGDIVISLPTAARQARAVRRTLAEEVFMLLAHGLLHLLGDDHQTDAQERRMTARTDMLRSVVARRRAQTHRRIARQIAGRSPANAQKGAKKHPRA